MNNQKKLDNETSESVDGGLPPKNFVKIYNENETKLTNILYSFFFFFSSSKCVKIARLAIQQNPINKVIKESKRKNQKKITLFLNSFSIDQIDVFSELL